MKIKNWKIIYQQIKRKYVIRKKINRSLKKKMKTKNYQIKFKKTNILIYNKTKMRINLISKYMSKMH